MTSGGQCVTTAGTVLMLLWSASSSDMELLEVSDSIFQKVKVPATLPMVQVELHTAMLGLELVLDLSTWMMFLVLQVLASCWSAIAGQSWHITVITLLMRVWGVKVIFYLLNFFPHATAVLTTKELFMQ